VLEHQREGVQEKVVMGVVKEEEEVEAQGRSRS